MESLAAASLAANVIQFLEFGSKVIKRLHDFRESQGEVPKVFRGIDTRLPLLVEGLKRCITEQLPKDTENALAQILSRCQGHVQSLNRILADVLPAKSDSWTTKNRKALLSLRKEKEVNHIEEDLRRCVEVLTFHHVLPNKASTLQKIDSGVSPDLDSSEKACRYFEVPRRHVPHFVGREEVLSNIEKSFQKSAIVVLQGMGGQGKTQIALEYCRRSRNKKAYAGIFWVDAISETQLLRSFESMAEVLKPADRAFENAEQSILFLKNSLEESIQPWLLIFDNHDDPVNFSNVAEYLPARGGHVLFTTRHSDVCRYGVQIALTGMTEAECLHLFFHRVNLERSDDNVEHAKTVVERLGHHPLALDQAAAYLNKRKMTLGLAHFVEHYEKRKEDILKSTPKVWEYKRQRKGDDREVSLSVFTTWELSFERLVQESQYGHEYSRLLSLLAFFHGREISEFSFAAFYKAGQPSNDCPTWMAVFTEGGRWSQEKFEDALIELGDLALIQAHYKDRNGIVHASLHPLVRDWIQVRVSPKERSEQCLLHARILEAHLQLTRPNNFSWFSFEDTLAILSHITALEENHQHLSPPHTQVENTDLLVGVYSTVACFLESSNRYGDAEKLVQRALDLQSHSESRSVHRVLQLISWRGTLLKHLGRYEEANMVFRHAGGLCTMYSLFDGPEMIRNIIGMADSLSTQGRYLEARDLFCEAATRANSSLGRKHDLTVFSLESLATVLELRGEFEEAVNVYYDLIALRLADLPHDHSLILFLRSSLAKVFASMGRYKEAEHINRTSLPLWTKSHGAKHPWTLRNNYILGYVLCQLGRYSEAEDILRSTLTSEEHVYGKDSPKTLATLGPLTMTLVHIGKLDEALHIAERAISIRELSEGQGDHITLSLVGSLRILGLVLNAQGKCDEAEPILDDVYDKRQRTLGDEHFVTISTLHDLATVHRDAGNKDVARALFYTAWTKRRETLAKDHPRISLSAVEYALLLDISAQTQDAEEILEQAKSALATSLDKVHPIHDRISRALENIHNIRVNELPQSWRPVGT